MKRVSYLTWYARTLGLFLMQNDRTNVYKIFLFVSVDYLCIGKTPSGTTFPLYDNPTENYCTGYVSCSATGVATFASCPASSLGQTQYLNIATLQCSTTFPVNQGCWRGIKNITPLYGKFSLVLISCCYSSHFSGTFFRLL